MLIRDIWPSKNWIWWWRRLRRWWWWWWYFYYYTGSNTHTQVLIEVIARDTNVTVSDLLWFVLHQQTNSQNVQSDLFLQPGKIASIHSRERGTKGQRPVVIKAANTNTEVELTTNYSISRSQYCDLIVTVSCKSVSIIYAIIYAFVKSNQPCPADD